MGINGLLCTIALLYAPRHKRPLRMIDAPHVGWREWERTWGEAQSSASGLRACCCQSSYVSAGGSGVLSIRADGSRGWGLTVSRHCASKAARHTPTRTRHVTSLVLRAEAPATGSDESLAPVHPASWLDLDSHRVSAQNPRAKAPHTSARARRQVLRHGR
jgi:hypothetical protein